MFGVNFNLTALWSWFGLVTAWSSRPGSERREELIQIVPAVRPKGPARTSAGSVDLKHAYTDD
jgi:hypothetical protein